MKQLYLIKKQVLGGEHKWIPFVFMTDSYSNSVSLFLVKHNYISTGPSHERVPASASTTSGYRPGGGPVGKLKSKQQGSKVGRAPYITL